MRGDTKSALNWYNISHGMIKISPLQQFHIICRQFFAWKPKTQQLNVFKPSNSNSKKKPLNKKTPNPQLIWLASFHFSPFRLPKKELPSHPTPASSGFKKAKIQEVKKLPKAQSHPYLPRYNGGRKPRVWKSSHVWSYKFGGDNFFTTPGVEGGEISHPKITQFIRSFNL